MADLIEKYAEICTPFLLEGLEKNKWGRFIISKLDNQFYNNILLDKKLGGSKHKELQEDTKKLLSKLSRKNFSHYIEFNEDGKHNFEFLIREGCKLLANEVWLVLDKKNNPVAEPFKPSMQLVQVNIGNFSEFEQMLSVFFEKSKKPHDFLKLCKESLCITPSGKMASFFMLKERDEFIAGLGLFFSKRMKFGYIPFLVSLGEYFDKAYHIDLLKYVLGNMELLGIDQLMTIARLDSELMSDCVRLGFEVEKVFGVVGK